MTVTMRTPIERGRRLARRGIDVGRQLAQELHGAASRVAARYSGGPGPKGATAPSAARLASILRSIEAGLAENVLPFWTRHAPDEEHGGFITHLDRTGGRLGPTDKYLVSQTRMIWTLAAASRRGFPDRGYAEMAGQGAQFLTKRMWDETHGGFLWAVTRNGSPLREEKRVYGQAFAIYALAECAMATGSEDALTWAARTLDVLVERAADEPFGFREVFARDWTPAPGPAGDNKTLEAHLHLVEAMTALADASRLPRHVALLTQLVDLLITNAINPRHGFAWEAFDRGWRPAHTRREPARVSYGHEAELSWILLDAMDVLGRSREGLRGPLLGLVDHALTYGFDRVRGGLALYGPPVGDVRHALYLPAGRLTKVWWQQAEMLVATLEAYRWTGAVRYLVAFEKQFEWIWRYQTDHVGGDWYEATTWREGRPLWSNKGYEWKDPYHQARALMKTSQGLRALGIRPAT